ncbi:hypothetical protein L7F22_059600 [Adiantum nelumboides]|nr:hypothetical protein [Adiantum nelumboides]
MVSSRLGAQYDCSSLGATNTVEAHGRFQAWGSTGAPDTVQAHGRHGCLSRNDNEDEDDGCLLLSSGDYNAGCLMLSSGDDNAGCLLPSSRKNHGKGYRVKEMKRHRSAFERGGPSSIILEDSEPCKITPCKTDSYLGDGLQKIELTKSQLEAMLTWKTHIEVSKQSLQEALEAACKLEMEVDKKCSTITGTHDWILSTIQNLQSEMLKTELRKEIDKMQQDIIAATNEPAKHDHERIVEKMRGSNEFMLNTNCLANSLYVEGLRSVHPAPVEHPVCPASLFVSIECNTIVWEATSVEPTAKTTVQELTSVELGTSNTIVWEATSVKPTTKTTVQELTFVKLGTNNTTIWEATSVEPTTKTTVQEHEVTAAATSVEVTAKLDHKATMVEEHKATSNSSIVKEHNATTVEAANVNKLEEATPDIDGDNLKLSSFIPAGIKMRKSRSRPTHNGSDLVHLPKTRSGSK